MTTERAPVALGPIARLGLHGSRRLFLFGLTLGLVLLGVVLIRADLHLAFAAVSRIQFEPLWIPVLATVGLAALRAWRWQAMFPIDVRPGYWLCLRTTVVGNLASVVVAGRAGDVLRCVLIGRDHRAVPTSAALATVGLEKILDGLALLAVLVASCAIVSPPAWLTTLAALAALGFGGGLSLLVLLRGRTAWLVEHVQTIGSALHLPRAATSVTRVLTRFALGLTVVSSLRQMIRLVLMTAGVWIGEALIVWSLAQALSLSLAAPGAVVVVAVIGLGLSVPTAPGFIGTYEFFGVAALGLFGFGPDTALGLTLVLHAWALLSMAALGLLGLGASHLAQPHATVASVRES